MATQRYGADNTQNIPYSAVPPPPPPIPLRNLILAAVLCLATLPSFLLMRLIGLTTSKDTVSEYINSNFGGPDIVESQYRILLTQEASLKRRRLAAFASASSLIATLLFSSLRSTSFLGSPLLNWSFLATVVFCSRYFLDASINVSVAALGPRYRRSKRWGYYASGLNQPFGSALHSTLIFITWQFLHFATVLQPITRYGVWVFGAWLVRCMLIFGNAAVMSRWRANAVYERFEERILRIGFQKYILYTLIPVATVDLSFMAPWRKKEGEVEIVQVARDGRVEDICCKVEDHIRYISGHRATTEEVAAIALCAQTMTALMPEELAENIGEVVRTYHGIAPGDGEHIDKRWLKDKFRLGDEDARVLYGELCVLVASPHEVSYNTFSSWMDGAYKDDQEVGRTLREEDEAIINSDRLLMGLLINMAFLLWLFFTGKTTTQVFVVIPFVYLAKLFVEELLSPQFRLLIG